MAPTNATKDRPSPSQSNAPVQGSPSPATNAKPLRAASGPDAHPQGPGRQSEPPPIGGPVPAAPPPVQAAGGQAPGQVPGGQAPGHAPGGQAPGHVPGGQAPGQVPGEQAPEGVRHLPNGRIRAWVEATEDGGEWTSEMIGQLSTQRLIKRKPPISFASRYAAAARHSGIVASQSRSCSVVQTACLEDGVGISAR